MKKIKWHFRNNEKRRNASKRNGRHPSLVIGESDDGNYFYNLGITHSSRRGHHKNIRIHNPKDWNKTSYIRDDMRKDLKVYLSEVLRDFNLCPDDVEKIVKIINKKEPPQGGSH